MKKQIHVFYKATSLILATCLLLVSCFSFPGCSYEEDYSVLKERKVPAILENIKLQKNDDLIVNLKKSLITKNEINGNLRPAYIDKIESIFGEPNWEESQLTTYDNGQSGIYTPIMKDKQVTAFLLSKFGNKSFKSIIIEILPENNEGDKIFSGSIHFFTVNCVKILSYSYKDGKSISTLTSNDQLVRLKSGYAEGDCSFSCLSSCISEVLGLDPLYGFACGLACGSFGTVFGAFMCIACIGGPALYCLDQCCEVF